VAFCLHDDINEDLLHPAQQMIFGIPENEGGCASGVLLGEGGDQ
jgi:hypothetical protein